MGTTAPSSRLSAGAVQSAVGERTEGNSPHFPTPALFRLMRPLIGMTLFGMRNGLWLLLFFCHSSESFLLLATPTARQGGGSPLVRPLEGSEFFDACSSAPVAIVLFHGEQCRSCKAFTPKFARLAQQYQGQAEFFRVVASRNTALCAAENVMTLLPW